MTATEPPKPAPRPAPMPSPAEIALLRTRFRYSQSSVMRRDAYRRLRALGLDPISNS